MASHSKFFAIPPLITLTESTSSDFSSITELASQEPHCDFTSKQLLAYQEKKNLLAINLDQTCVGFIAYREIAGEVELDQIAVNSSYRGQGIGTQAFDQWLNHLQLGHVNVVFLEVSSLNEPAKALYFHFGFEQVGLRKNYYRIDGQTSDALLLKKTL